jgi:hypothetical protein
MDKGIHREPLFKSGKEEGSSAESNAVAPLPARTEASRQDALDEDLQPLNGHPPPEKEETPLGDAPSRKKPVQRTREDQLVLAREQRDMRTGYALRHKPKKARSKDL